MSSHHPEARTRFAHDAGATSAQAALTALATSAAADVARAGSFAVDDESGLRHASDTAAPREQVQLGGPPWLFPAFLGVIAAIVLVSVGVYWYQDRGNHADRSVFEHTTIAIPAAAAGLTLGTGPGVQAGVERVNRAMADLGLSEPVSAVYLDGSGTSVVLVGAGKKITAPNHLVATAETTKSTFVSGTAPAVALEPITLKRVPPGPLGGVLRCGPTSVASVAVTYCVAADEGSVAQFLIAGSDQGATSTTARTMRTAVVQRG